MAASFHIDYPGSAGDFVLNATKAIKGKGGIFSGDEQKGSSQVAITITQKPPLVPMSKIKSVIADNL
jgi:hypothetical protein